jgi:hypothetical protein
MLGEVVAFTSLLTVAAYAIIRLRIILGGRAGRETDQEKILQIGLIIGLFAQLGYLILVR